MRMCCLEDCSAWNLPFRDVLGHPALLYCPEHWFDSTATFQQGYFTGVQQKRLLKGEQFDLMHPDAQVGFWKKCVELKAATDGLRYKQVRALLVRKMSERLIKESASKSVGEYRPFSYYERLGRLGYNVDDIEAKAESKECPIVGQCVRGYSARPRSFRLTI